MIRIVSLAVILMMTAGLVLPLAISHIPEKSQGTVLQTEKTEEMTGVTEEIVRVTGMSADKAKSFEICLRDAGIENASGFALIENTERRNYELSFQSDGITYTAVLSRLMLLEQIKDETGKTVFAVIR